MRMSALVLLTLILATPVRAEITIHETVTATGPAGQSTGTRTTYIKGNKMRLDIASPDGREQKIIVDFDAHNTFVLDSGAKRVTVWHMDALAADVAARVDATRLNVLLQPNHRTKRIQEREAIGYDLAVWLPVRRIDASAEAGKTVSDTSGTSSEIRVARLTAEIWLVNGAPGVDQYAAFHTMAAQAGGLIDDPATAEKVPAHSAAMAAMCQELAKAGGIPYEIRLRSIVAAENDPLLSLMAAFYFDALRLTRERSRDIYDRAETAVVQRISLEPLPDSWFAVPADYDLITRK